MTTPKIVPSVAEVTQLIDDAVAGITVPPPAGIANPFRKLRFISQPGPVARVADFPTFRSARMLGAQLFHAGAYLENPIDEWYLYSGTDHDTSGDGGGIYLWTGPSPDVPFTPHGTDPIYVDSTSGLQTEFPSILWEPNSRNVFLYYIFNIHGTALAVSPDGLAFERIGEVIQPAPGGYTGYPTVSRLGAQQWICSHLAWAGDQGRYALSRSLDGIVWTKDPLVKTGQLEVTQDPGYKSHGPQRFFRVDGELWGVGASRLNGASGQGGQGDERHVAGPVTADLRQWARPAERCWTPQAPWEQGPARGLYQVLVDGGVAWGTYRGGDGTSIGVAKGEVIDGEAA